MNILIDKDAYNKVNKDNDNFNNFLFIYGNYYIKTFKECLKIRKFEKSMRII